MIGKTTITLTKESVKEALEEYVNKHLLHPHQMKVTDFRQLGYDPQFQYSVDCEPPSETIEGPRMELKQTDGPRDPLPGVAG